MPKPERAQGKEARGSGRLGLLPPSFAATCASLALRSPSFAAACASLALRCRYCAAMQALKRAQKDKVRSLISFTGVSEGLAIQLLKACDWQTDMAADSFFMGGGAPSAPSVDSAKIAAIFDGYKGERQRALLPSSVEPAVPSQRLPQPSGATTACA